MSQQAEFRFYEELNDFLPPARRKTTIDYRFSGSPSIKDASGLPSASHSGSGYQRPATLLTSLVWTTANC